MRRLTLRNVALGLLILFLVSCFSCKGEEPAAAPPEGGVAPEGGAPKKAGKKAARGGGDSGEGATSDQESRALNVEMHELHYDATDKWDPFIVPTPPIITTPSSERYDLDQMTLLGIIRGSGMDAAYIRLPDGSYKIVRIGDTLGKHGGQ